MTELEKYSKLFSNLHTAKVKGQKAPHKAILLLAIIELIEKEIINSTHIELSEELVECFKETWKCNLGHFSIFCSDIAKPFFHMQHESFWKLVDYEEACVKMVAEDSMWIDDDKSKKTLPNGSYSLRTMRQTFAYAEIDNTLFQLLHNANARAMLRGILINEYLKNQPAKTMSNFVQLMMALPFIVLVA